MIGGRTKPNRAKLHINTDKDNCRWDVSVGPNPLEDHNGNAKESQSCWGSPRDLPVSNGGGLGGATGHQPMPKTKACSVTGCSGKRPLAVGLVSSQRTSPVKGDLGGGWGPPGKAQQK